MGKENDVSNSTACSTNTITDLKPRIVNTPQDLLKHDMDLLRREEEEQQALGEVDLEGASPLKETMDDFDVSGEPETESLKEAVSRRGNLYRKKPAHKSTLEE